MNTVHLSDKELMIVSKVDLALRALDYCCLDQEGSITLIVEHTNGTKVVADLYVHAALVQGLMEALEYFKSEL